jgi:predicted nucleotidyltransferase
MKPSDLLATHRDAIRQIVAAHRASNPRVFGSVLHAADTEASDLDLLIGPTEATTLFDIGAIMGELKDLLGIPVDVVTPRALPEKWHARVPAEAQPV